MLKCIAKLSKKIKRVEIVPKMIASFKIASLLQCKLKKDGETDMTSLKLCRNKNNSDLDVISESSVRLRKFIKATLKEVLLSVNMKLRF